MFPTRQTPHSPGDSLADRLGAALRHAARPHPRQAREEEDPAQHRTQDHDAHGAGPRTPHAHAEGLR